MHSLKIYMPHTQRHQYTLRRSARAKRLRIQIEPDATVTVVAPHRLGVRKIDQFVHEQRLWITRQLVRQKRQKRMTLEGSFEQYKARAKKFVRDRVKYFAELHGFEHGRVSVKQTTSQWGSCSAEKNLSFSHKIYFLPPELADYVIVHELCHTREMNHGKRFHALFRHVQPDYKKRRALLKKYLLT